MIAPIVVAMFRTEILWKGSDPSESFFDHLRFPERTAANGNGLRHLSRLRFEVVLVFPHHPFPQERSSHFR